MKGIRYDITPILGSSAALLAMVKNDFIIAIA